MSEQHSDHAGYERELRKLLRQLGFNEELYLRETPATVGDFANLIEAIPRVIEIDRDHSLSIYDAYTLALSCVQERVINELRRTGGEETVDRLLDKFWESLGWGERDPGPNPPKGLDQKTFQDFADRVRRLSSLRWEGPFSIYDLTKRFGVSDDTIRNWASKKTPVPPTISAIRKVAQGHYEYIPA